MVMIVGLALGIVSAACVFCAIDLIHDHDCWVVNNSHDGYA